MCYISIHQHWQHASGQSRSFPIDSYCISSFYRTVTNSFCGSFKSIFSMCSTAFTGALQTEVGLLRTDSKNTEPFILVYNSGTSSKQASKSLDYMYKLNAFGGLNLSCTVGSEID